jgi:uncharacterized RDD family membrane protein YckC
MEENMEVIAQFIPLALIVIIIAFSIYFSTRSPIRDNEFYYAGFWMRFVAAVIDAIISTTFVLIPALGLGVLLGWSMAGTASPYKIEATAEALGNLLGIICGWLYFAIMESSKHQATFGKKLLGLKVIGSNGDQISFGKATGRYFGKFISLLTFFIGFMMIGWTKRKQGLHDKLANCLVVRAESKDWIYDGKTSVQYAPNSHNKDAAQRGGFEEEALQRYKNGELSEEAFMEIIKSKK